MGESLSEGHILFVDDRPQNAALFSRVLKIHGITNEVIPAGDGIEALEYLFGTGQHAGRGTRMPRLIILDMRMPRMGGLETLRRIRADRRTEIVPVVVFSSSDDPQDMLEAYRLGANSYVDKVSLNLPYPEIAGMIARYWLLVNEPPPGT